MILARIDREKQLQKLRKVTKNLDNVIVYACPNCTNFLDMVITTNEKGVLYLVCFRCGHLTRWEVVDNNIKLPIGNSYLWKK